MPYCRYSFYTLSLISHTTQYTESRGSHLTPRRPIATYVYMPRSLRMIVRALPPTLPARRVPSRDALVRGRRKLPRLTLTDEAQ